MVSSPGELAEIINNYFIETIKKIREKFTWSQIRPIEILTELIPRCHESFLIQEISIDQTKQIIKNVTPTASTGHDDINNNIIIKIINYISPHMTHLLNSIIKTTIVTDIF